MNLNFLCSRDIYCSNDQEFAVDLIFIHVTVIVDFPSPFKILKAPIDREVEARFLGVVMDESLNWSRHVKTVL